MKRAVIAACVALSVATPAFAQEGGTVFANNPNELPQFLHDGTPNPDQWAGQFFHSQVRPERARQATAQRETTGHAVN